MKAILPMVRDGATKRRRDEVRRFGGIPLRLYVSSEGKAFTASLRLFYLGDAP